MPTITMPRASLWSFACLGLLVGFAGTARAQGVPQGLSQGYSAGMAFIGESGRMGPNCPPIQFHVVPQGNNQLSGVAFETMVGATPATDHMHIYSVSGNIGNDGTVAMNLKSVDNGPSFKVDGVFKAGMLMASMDGGAACHSTSFMLMPVSQPAAAGNK